MRQINATFLVEDNYADEFTSALQRFDGKGIGDKLTAENGILVSPVPVIGRDKVSDAPILPRRYSRPDVTDMLEKLESAQARLLKLETRMSDISFGAANRTDNSITLAKCLAAQDDIKNAKSLLADAINGINRNSAASDGEEDGE